MLIDLRRHLQFEVFVNPIASIVGFRVPFGTPAQVAATAWPAAPGDESATAR